MPVEQVGKRQFGAFKGKIEAEIVKNLDDLLAPKAAAAKKPKKA